MNLNNFLAYPATIRKEEDGYCVNVQLASGKNWPTCGDTYEEAMEMAHAVIIDMAEFLAGREPIPAPAKPGKDDVMIQLTPEEALKIMLRNAMFSEGIGLTALARATGMRPQNAFKILDFRAASKLSSLMPMFAAVGHPLKISC